MNNIIDVYLHICLDESVSRYGFIFDSTDGVTYESYPVQMKPIWKRSTFIRREKESWWSVGHNAKGDLKLFLL
jgi:hypothetical protein